MIYPFTRPQSSTHLAYGLEAPRLVYTLLIIGLCLGFLGFVSLRFHLQWQWLGFLAVLAMAFAGLFLLVGGWMVWSAFKGKAKAAHFLLSSLKLKPQMSLLDLGCGRGLVLLEAAKLLTRGRVVGLDNWSQFDLYPNSSMQTLDNARWEGVEKRVKVDSGDMRDLPYPPNAFDRLTAHLSLHQLGSRSDRLKTLEEIKRVLKPKGLLAIADFQYIHQLTQDLRILGFKNIQVSGYQFFYFPPVKLILAQK